METSISCFVFNVIFVLFILKKSVDRNFIELFSYQNKDE